MSIFGEEVNGRWLAKIMLGAILGTLGTMSTWLLNHEHRLSQTETRQEIDQAFRDRIERKLDRVLQAQQVEEKR